MVTSQMKYIFCINTGRSGSDYLSKIFDHVSGCQSFHEPNPICNGQVMYRYALGELEPMRKAVREKVEAIKKKGESLLYVEINHCFIKGFGWFIPQYFPEENIGVIFLKRERSKIAESLMRVGASPLDKLGRKWISTPEMKEPLVPP